MRVAITGGPGVGKTALLHELRARGFATVEETARAIIRSRRAQGLSARSSSLEFAEQVLQCDIERYEQNGNEGLAFFDRGVLDALAMIVEAAPQRRAEVAALAANYSYHLVAFFLPPWEQIYVNDEERDQSFTDAVRVHDSLVAWYELCGYRIATVPTVSVAERCNYVLSALSASDAQPIARLDEARLRGTLRQLELLLAHVCEIDSLSERKPGIFYRGSSAFLHFHEDAVGLFADVKLSGKHFERMPVSTDRQRRDFLHALCKYSRFLAVASIVPNISFESRRSASAAQLSR